MKLTITNTGPITCEIDIEPGYCRNFVNELVCITETQIIRCKIWGDDNSTTLKTSPLTELEACYAFLNKPLTPITAEEFIVEYDKVRQAQSEAFALSVKGMVVPDKINGGLHLNG